MSSWAARRFVWNRQGSAFAFGDRSISGPTSGQAALSVKLSRILRREKVCFGKVDQCHNRELTLINLFWSPHINQVSTFNTSSSRAVISRGSSVVTFRPNIKTNRDIYGVYRIFHSNPDHRPVWSAEASVILFSLSSLTVRRCRDFRMTDLGLVGY